MDENRPTTHTEIPVPPDQPAPQKRRRDIFPGLFILAVGVIFLLKQTGVVFPYWFFTWPVLLIAVGIFSGIKHGFRGGGWIVPILIGALFVTNDIVPQLSLGKYIWPIVIIFAGLMLIIRPKRTHRWKHWNRNGSENNANWNNFMHQNEAADVDNTNDFIDITTVFGGVKKIILSKNFRGGDLMSLMAGTELNLTQADIHGVVTIDATNIFGGTKLVIPPTWDVQSEVVAIFGGVDDKRQVSAAAIQPNKILRLEGTCIFGGIDIRSY